MMDKHNVLQLIIQQLQADLELLERAARTAHQAATDSENLPDNKYETLALEASYLAQGQANRAQQVRLELADFKSMVCRRFTSDDVIRLSALVTLEDGDGNERLIFLGPGAGGLKVPLGKCEVMVVTPQSPLGRGLLGLQVGDQVSGGQRQYEIVDLR